MFIPFVLLFTISSGMAQSILFQERDLFLRPKECNGFLESRSYIYQSMVYSSFAILNDDIFAFNKENSGFESMQFDNSLYYLVNDVRAYQLTFTFESLRHNYLRSEEDQSDKWLKSGLEFGGYFDFFYKIPIKIYLKHTIDFKNYKNHIEYFSLGTKIAIERYRFRKNKWTLFDNALGVIEYTPSNQNIIFTSKHDGISNIHLNLTLDYIRYNSLSLVLNYSYFSDFEKKIGDKGFLRDRRNTFTSQAGFVYDFWTYPSSLTGSLGVVQYANNREIFDSQFIWSVNLKLPFLYSTFKI